MADSPLNISSWLETGPDSIPDRIFRCQLPDHGASRPNSTFGDCNSVCNDSMMILDPSPPNNLLTCGLWSTVLMRNYYNSIIKPASYPQAGVQLLEFASLGLRTNYTTYPYEAVGPLSTSLEVLQKASRFGPYQADKASQGACGQPVLFPSNLESNLTKQLHKCVDVICLPQIINPNLGGIGVSQWSCRQSLLLMSNKVYVSLLMQLSLTLIIFGTFLLLELWPKKTQRRI